MEKILVTGGTGFVGQRLLKSLKSIECEIHTLSRKPNPDYKTIVCDLESKTIPENALKGIEKVFHLAGYAHDSQNSNKVNKLYQAINVDATARLAEIAVQQGVKKFIFVSSVKAGGSSVDGLCLSEEDQSDPEGIYGKSKRSAELKLLDIGCNSDMQISILRPSLIYGPNVKGNLKLMLSWIEKGWFPPIPEVNNKRSLIHVDDLVKAILKVADNNNTNGEIFIAAEEKTYTSREIFEAMCILHGKGVPKWSVPKFLFDFLALISPKLRHEFKKIFKDAYYSPKKLHDLGYKTEFNLKDWKKV